MKQKWQEFDSSASKAPKGQQVLGPQEQSGDTTREARSGHYVREGSTHVERAKTKEKTEIKPNVVTSSSLKRANVLEC